MSITVPQGTAAGGMLFLGVLLLLCWAAIFALLVYRLRMLLRESTSFSLNIVFLPMKATVLVASMLWVFFIVCLRLQFWLSSHKGIEVASAYTVLADAIARPVAVLAFCYLAGVRTDRLTMPSEAAQKKAFGRAAAEAEAEAEAVAAAAAASAAAQTSSAAADDYATVSNRNTISNTGAAAVRSSSNSAAIASSAAAGAGNSIFHAHTNSLSREGGGPPPPFSPPTSPHPADSSEASGAFAASGREMATATYAAAGAPSQQDSAMDASSTAPPSTHTAVGGGGGVPPPLLGNRASHINSSSNNGRLVAARGGPNGPQHPSSSSQLLQQPHPHRLTVSIDPRLLGKSAVVMQSGGEEALMEVRAGVGGVHPPPALLDGIGGSNSFVAGSASLRSSPSLQPSAVGHARGGGGPNASFDLSSSLGGRGIAPPTASPSAAAFGVGPTSSASPNAAPHQNNNNSNNSTSTSTAVPPSSISARTSPAPQWAAAASEIARYHHTQQPQQHQQQSVVVSRLNTAHSFYDVGGGGSGHQQQHYFSSAGSDAGAPTSPYFDLYGGPISFQQQQQMMMAQGGGGQQFPPQRPGRAASAFSVSSAHNDHDGYGDNSYGYGPQHHPQNAYNGGAPHHSHHFYAAAANSNAAGNEFYDYGYYAPSANSVGNSVSQRQTTTGSGGGGGGGFSRLWQQSLHTARCYVQGIRSDEEAYGGGNPSPGLGGGGGGLYPIGNGSPSGGPLNSNANGSNSATAASSSSELWELSARWALITGTRYYTFLTLTLLALYLALAVAVADTTEDCANVAVGVSDTESCYAEVAEGHYVAHRPRIFDALGVLWFGIFVFFWCFCGVRMITHCGHKAMAARVRRRFFIILAILIANWAWTFLFVFEALSHGPILGFMEFSAEVFEALLVVAMALSLGNSSGVVWGSRMREYFRKVTCLKGCV